MSTTKPRSKSNSKSKSKSKSLSDDKNYYFTPVETNDILDSPRAPLTKPSTETHHSSKSRKNGKYQSISVSPSLSSSQSKSPSELQSSPSTSLSNNHDNQRFIDHLQKRDPSQTSKSYRPWYYKCTNWLKIFISMGLLTLLTLAVVFNDITMKYSEIFLNWMDDHPFLGSIAYIGLYILSGLLMFPGMII